MSKKVTLARQTNKLESFKNYRSPFEDLIKTFSIGPHVFDSLLDSLNETQRAVQAITDNYSKAMGSFDVMFGQFSVPIQALGTQNLVVSSGLDLFAKNLNEYMLQQQRMFDEIHEGFARILQTTGMLKSQTLFAQTLENFRFGELKIFTESVGTPALAQLSENILKANKLAMRDAISNDFLDELTLTIKDTAIGPNVEIDEEFINNIGAKVSEQTQKLEPNKISAQGMLEILMAIMTILLLYIAVADLYESYESGEVLESLKEGQVITNRNLELSNEKLEQLVVLGETILPHIEQLAPEETEETKIFFIVKHISLLRAKPGRKGMVITKLYPNQKVELIKKEDNWVYVSYFDYREGIPKLGWVYRKNLILARP